MKGKIIGAIAAATLPLLLAAPGVIVVSPPLALAQQAAALSPEQLGSILAPIALYPDALLTNVLMASAYPDEVADAAQWLQDPGNAALRGDQLNAALEPQPWDPSVKALVPFPQLVNMMASHPDWMRQLGTAFANQQPQVMAEVQHLRRLARAAGKLQSSPQIVVQEQGPAIVIQPASPGVVYVPVYDPVVVYGAWPYPAFRPIFFAPPPGFVVAGVGLNVGLGFSVGFGINAGLWGWATPAWGLGRVDINVAVYNRINRFGQPWRGGAVWHPVAHGAGYWHGAAATRFQQHQRLQHGPGARPGGGPSAGKGAKGPGGPGTVGAPPHAPAGAGAGKGLKGPGRPAPGGAPPHAPGGPGAGKNIKGPGSAGPAATHNNNMGAPGAHRPGPAGGHPGGTPNRGQAGKGNKNDKENH